MGSSSSLCRTHDRTALGSSRGGGGGGDGRRVHNSYDGGSGGGRRSSDDSRAKVGPSGRGRRGAAYSRSKAMSSMHLHHGWAREEEERRGWEGESFRSDGEEMEWLGMKMEAVGKRGGGGGGGGGFK